MREAPLDTVSFTEEELSLLAKREIHAFEEFSKVYRVQHPPPRRENASLEWEFWFALATSISAVVLAAFRTGQAFYLAAVSRGNPLLAFLEALSAVVAIEGSVVLFAVYRARIQRKTESAASEAGLWTAFLISALAGLFQSVTLISSPSQFAMDILNISLVIAMGLGATVIAWLGGDLLGVHLVILQERIKEIEDRYVRAMQSYRAAALREWRTRQSVTPLQRTEKTPPQHPTAEARERVIIPTEEIFHEFDRILSEGGRVGGVNEVARLVAAKRNESGSEEGWENLKGRISAIRSRWMKERGIIDGGSAPAQQAVENGNS